MTCDILLDWYDNYFIPDVKKCQQDLDKCGTFFLN